MIEVLALDAERWIAALFYPLVRILSLIATAPVLGHMSVPMRVKVLLGVVITFAVAPGLPMPVVGLSDPRAILVIAQQILIGAAMGFTLRVIIAGIELAGELIGMQMGLNFAGFFDPASASQGTPIGAWLGLLATLLFLCANGHLQVIAAVAESFRYLPVDPGASIVADWRKVVHVGAELFRIGFYVVLPVMAATLICNITMGVLTRMAPQLNLLAVGFPVTLAVGFWMLLAALPFIVPYLETTLQRALSLTLPR